MGYKEFAKILRATNNRDVDRDLHQAKTENTLTRYCSDARLAKTMKQTRKLELKKEISIGWKLLKK